MSSPNIRNDCRHRARVAALAAGVSLCLLGAPFVQAQTVAPTLDRSTAAQDAAVQLPSLSPLVKKVLPAVVNVSVTMNASNPVQQEQEQEQAGPGEGQPFPNFPNSPFDRFLRKFFEQQQQGGHGPAEPQAKRMALGSGFIIDPSGYVVTNNHVVQNSDKVTVIFQDDSKHPAKVVGRDAKTDLALLKIDAPHPLPFVQWGDSGTSQVGDWVLAVGNPFGLGGTVSAGIVSARGRDIHSGPYDDFLQIDASINRGNSGGPTFSLDGKVIGINTAIYSPNGGSVGIGFAIPANLAKPVIEQLKEHGKVERGWLGVQIQEVTPDLARSLGLPKAEGALVADVTADAPAAKIGIKQGDVILGYDGHDIVKMRDLPLAVAETPIGHKEPVKLWRDGHEMTLEPTIAAMPANPEQVAQNEHRAPAQPQTTTTMGLKLAPLTADLRRELHVPHNVNGVVVTGVSQASPLAELGLAPGDVIQAINREPMHAPKDVGTKLTAMRKDGSKNLLILINRHGINQYVALSMGSGDKG
jgi:serine protease Do